jgi:hypothetical protein
MRARYAWPAVAIMVAAASPGGGAAAAATPGHAHGPGVPRGPSRAGAAMGDSALTWAPADTVESATPYVTPNFVEDVSCVAGPLCVGVDAEGNVITSAHPAGGASAWTVTSVGTAPLFAVSCASASLCAAGAELNGDDQGSVAVSSDPAASPPAWQVDTIPGLQNVAGMSCPTTSLCVGVDTNNQVIVSADPAGGASAWQLFTVPEVTQGYGFVAVSCPAATLCLAVDGNGNIYVSRDPGGGAPAWVHTAALKTPNGPVHVNYRGLACASVKLCLVLGDNGMLYAATRPAGGDSAWTGSGNADLAPVSVSCAKAPVCVVTGYVGTTPGFAASATPTEPLSEWSTQTGGNVKYGPANAVSCTGKSLCVAVDSGGDAIVSTQPAGGFWTTAEVDGSTPLTGISCPSSLLCVAVGDSGVLVARTYTITTANGLSAVWTPADVDGTQDLNGVSCPSPTLCVAIDDQGDVLTSTTPAGGAPAWKPATITGQPLTAISCTAAPLCVATDGAGDVFTSKDPAGGASAWKQATVTGSGGGGDVPPTFTAISCTTGPLCVAVDSAGDVITSKNPAGGASAWTVSYLGLSANLTGVSCTPSATCVATYSSGQMATSPDPAGGSSAWTVAAPVSGTLPALSAVKCAAAGLCVAVGGAELDAPGPGGPWTVNQTDSTPENMTAVDCAGTAMCVAVDSAGRAIVGTPPDDTFFWAGYQTQATGVTFTDVKATWVQPAVKCPDGGPDTSSFWIGIGGPTAVEQTGIEADCDGTNQPSYAAWYELYPSQAATPISRTVKPGDRIDAEVKLTGGKYVLTLDIGGQKPFSTKPVTAKGVQDSCVEWIAEDPNWYVGDPLSDFGSVNFSGGYATGNGKTGATGDPARASQALTMNTGFGPVPDAGPSGLSAKGTAFSVTWH